MSDEAMQCFVEHCLTDPFYRQFPDDVIDDDSLQMCEAVFSGLAEVAQVPRDCLSSTIYSLLTGSRLTAAYQLLPVPHQVCVTTLSQLIVIQAAYGLFLWHEISCVSE